jgi:hypothetical protein
MIYTKKILRPLSVRVCVFVTLFGKEANGCVTKPALSSRYLPIIHTVYYSAADSGSVAFLTPESGIRDG